jgi:hypothetical protein
MSNHITERLIENLLSDAMTLAGLTVLGYFAAFSFLHAQADALGIPGELISVSLESILIALLSLVGFAAGCSMAIELAMLVLPQRFRASVLFRPFASFAGVAVIVALSGLVFSPLLLAFEGVLFLALCLWLIPPLFSRSHGGTYFGRLSAAMEVHQERPRDEPEPTWLARRIGSTQVWIVVAILAIIVGANGIGRFYAWSRSYYYVSLSRPPEVLLERYGDVLVFRQQSSPAVTVRVIGKDAIPRLVRARTGSMAPNRYPNEPTL